MTAVKLASTVNMDKDEWLSQRKAGIGGSDAPVICGMNKYKSPVELWLEKTGKAAQIKQIEPDYLAEAAYWGHVIQPIITKEFILRSGLNVRAENFILKKAAS